MKSALRILFLLTAAACFAQTAWWEPVAPRIGDEVTFYYDANVGTLAPGSSIVMHWGVLDPGTGNWSTPPAEIWPAGSVLWTDNVALRSPMTNDGSGVYALTIDFNNEVEHIAFVFSSGPNDWDNNGGNNWVLDFLEEGLVSWWTPAEPEPGDAITIYYDCGPGTLPNNATNVILHWGVNEVGHGNWSLAPEEIRPAGTIVDGVACRTPMINGGNGVFNLTINTNQDIYTLHYVTTDGTNWDNNGDQNWDIFLEEPPPVTMTHRIFRFDPRSAFASFSGTINSLNLAGTFNGWSTAANPLTDVDPYGNYYGEVELPLGEVEYKFVVNSNNWQIDPDNPRNAPGGFNNSLMTVVADSFPQVYNISPFENSVFDVGSNVVVSMKIRSGDFGPGIDGMSVYVDGENWPSDWDAPTSTLTLDPLSSVEGARSIRVIVQDSSGRSSTNYLAYGFRNEHALYVDPLADFAYDGDAASDLTMFIAREWSNGDSIMFEFFLSEVDRDLSMILFSIAAETGSYSQMEGLDAEIALPGLNSGSATMLLLDPTNANFDSDIHNRLHAGGSLANDGPAVSVRFLPEEQAVLCAVAADDLTSFLGSYQEAWYYTCATLLPGSAAEGYCHEITAAEGGIDGIEEPDIYDAMFFMASDLEAKMFLNYGLNRRMTLDAPGRGVAAILPDDIGPNIQTPGPVCQILTRGAETTDDTQTIVGRVTSDIGLSWVRLFRNGNLIPVTMSADTFSVNVTLLEGANTFSIEACDVATDTGRSAAMIFTLVVDHSPQVSLFAGIAGNTVSLNASATTDPDDDPMDFLWIPDPDNPSAVTLSNANTSIATFDLPTVPGEYYFDLTVSDPDENSSNGRTFIRKYESAGGSPFQNNESADWVMNAVMYEIFVRSYSASGDFDGITADLDRIKSLGVDVIWLMPIFEGPSDHGYEITDYYAIEQDYGTAADFHELVEGCHERGIKIILDMVINHTGIGHSFMQDCIRNGHYSHYWDWYDRDNQGNYTYYYDWSSLPNINHNNPECAQYWIDMCKYWISEFDIDGYRCDVAWGPQQRSPQFWVNWRQQLKEIKPEVMLFAEAGANDFTILTDRFDLAKDWNLHHEGPAAFTNMFPAIPSFSNLTDLITNYGFPWPQYKGPLRFMENHDEARYISIKTPAQTRLVATLLMSIPGIPMLYAGQEIGTTSQRGLIPWGTDPNNFYPLYHRLTNARSQLPAMRTGDFTLIGNDQSGACYSYARTMDGEFPVVFLGNFSSTSQLVTVTLDAELLGIHPDSTYVVTELNAGTNFSRLGSELTGIFTSLSPYSGRVWAIGDSALILVDADPQLPELPDRIELLPAYPNPFNPSTTIPLALNQTRQVHLAIYDVLGREVATLVDGTMT
ncbi:hypothetical protein KKH18_10505, partial [bacterium]|nr:hypothetical protein [bacterium]